LFIVLLSYGVVANNILEQDVTFFKIFAFQNPDEGGVLQLPQFTIELLPNPATALLIPFTELPI